MVCEYWAVGRCEEAGRASTIRLLNKNMNVRYVTLEQLRVEWIAGRWKIQNLKDLSDIDKLPKAASKDKTLVKVVGEGVIVASPNGAIYRMGIPEAEVSRELGELKDILGVL